MAFYTCPRCGQNNPDTIACCSKCGLPVSQFFPNTDPPIQQPQNLNNGYYNAEPPASMPYQGNIPQNMNTPYMQYPNYGQGMPPKKNNTLIIILIIVIVALIIVGVVIAVLLMNQGNNSRQEQTSSVSEVAGASQQEQPSADIPSVSTPSATYSEPSVYTPSETYSEPSVYTPSETYSEPSVYTPSETYSEPSVYTPSETYSDPSDSTIESSFDIEQYLDYMKPKSQWSYFNDSRYANPNYKIPTPESCITTIKKISSDYDTSNQYGLYYSYEGSNTEDVIAYIVLMRALDYQFEKYDNSENPDQSFFYFSKDGNIVLSITIRSINSSGEIGMMVVRADYE